jgi:putative DNA primase/helicase
MSDDPDDPIIHLAHVRQQRQPTSATGSADHTDDALATVFVDLHVDSLRYVATWGDWMLWKGTHWKKDDTLEVFSRSRAVCRAASATVISTKLAAALASAKTVAAVVSLARSDRRIAKTVDIWDCNQGQLNTPETTIDLNPREA